MNASLSAAELASPPESSSPLLKWLGRVAYEPTWRAMQAFTEQRDAQTRDEIWLLEHDPVFTLGMNADRSHLLVPGDIPVVQIDRGGQVTYHGPGQLLIYPLIDVRRSGLGVRDLVSALERATIEYARRLGISAGCRPKAPGVYIEDRKLASVGLRIRRGGSYHGMALNVRMDLTPFSRINPCGYAGLQMTQLADFVSETDVRSVASQFGPLLVNTLRAMRDALGTAREDI